MGLFDEFDETTTTSSLPGLTSVKGANCGDALAKYLNETQGYNLPRGGIGPGEIKTLGESKGAPVYGKDNLSLDALTPGTIIHMTRQPGDKNYEYGTTHIGIVDQDNYGNGIFRSYTAGKGWRDQKINHNFINSLPSRIVATNPVNPGNRIVSQKEQDIFAALKQPVNQGKRGFAPYQIAAAGQEIPGPPSGLFDEFEQSSASKGGGLFNEFEPDISVITHKYHEAPLPTKNIPEPNTWADVAKGAGKRLLKPTAEWAIGVAKPIAEKITDWTETPERAAQIKKQSTKEIGRIIEDLTYAPQTTPEKVMDFLPRVAGGLLPYVGAGGTIGKLAGGLGSIPGSIATMTGAELPQAYTSGGAEAVKGQLPWSVGMGVGFGAIPKLVHGYGKQIGAAAGLGGGATAGQQLSSDEPVNPWDVAESAAVIGGLHAISGYKGWKAGRNADVSKDADRFKLDEKLVTPPTAEPEAIAAQKMLPPPQGGERVLGPEQPTLVPGGEPGTAALDLVPGFTMREPSAILRKAPVFGEPGYNAQTPVPPEPNPEVWLKSRGRATMDPETFRRRLLGMAEDLPDTAGLRTSPPITMPGQQPTPTQTIRAPEIVQPGASGEVAPESQAGRGVGEVDYNQDAKIKQLDAEVNGIRELSPQDELDAIHLKYGNKFEVTVSYPASLGENGNQTTFLYKEKPTVDDVVKDLTELYKEEKERINTEQVAGIVAKSARDENIEAAIDKTMSPAPAPERFPTPEEQAEYDLLTEKGKKERTPEENARVDELSSLISRARDYETGRIGLRKAERRPTAKALSPLDILIPQYEATGRVVHRYPRKKQVSLDGRTMAEVDAIQKMKEVLGITPTTPTLPPEAPGGVKKLYSGGPDTAELYRKFLKKPDLPDIPTLLDKGREYIAQGMSPTEATDQLAKDFKRSRVEIRDYLDNKTPVSSSEAGIPPADAKRIIQQKRFTLKEPAFDELFTSPKEAKGFLGAQGLDPENYLIRRNKNKNYTIHERVPRVPLYEDMADISDRLAKGPDLDAKVLGRQREKWSMEPAIGTFGRLERVAPGITEKLWYRAHELDTQAELRYQDFLKESEPFEAPLKFKSSKRIDAWAVAQQEHGPETLAAMKVRVKPLTNEELAYFDFGRRVYEETLPEINKARILAGKQPIAHREDYAPFIRKFNELLSEGGDPINVDAEYFHPLATPFKYAKARIGGTRPLELDFVRHLKQYMRTAYRHIELSPLVSTTRQMVNKIDLPDGKSIALRETKPTTANFLTKWADRVAGAKEEDFGPLIDKGMEKLARNNVVATLGGLLTTVVKQPTSMLQAWAKTSHDVGYRRGSQYMIAGIKDSMNPNKWAQAKAESKVLLTRELDTSLEGLKGKIGNIAFTPVSFMDMQAAMASWWAARRAATRMGLSKADGIRYADESLTRTQASASPIDRSPLQSRPAGRFAGQFQTFVLNDFDFIKKDILGINGPVDLTTGQRVGRLMMFAGGAALINTFYRDILGIDPPMPEPISAAYRKMQEGKGAGKVAGSAVAEFTKIAPLLGGMQYGSGMLGAGPALLADIGRLVTGNDFAPSPFKIGGKLLGVPFTEQAHRLYRASQGKMTPGEAVFGKAYDKKPKKKTTTTGGFGGF